MTRPVPLRHRWAWRLLSGALLAVLVLVITTLTLLGTATGNVWLLHRVQPHIPGTLKVQGWHGSLLYGLNVSELDYRHGGLSVRIEDLRLDLNIGALLHGRLHLRRLGASGVAVTTPPKANDTTDNTPFRMPDSVALPLGVRVDRLDLKRFTLSGAGDLRIDAIQGRDLAAWQRFDLGHLALTIADTRIHARLGGGLSRPYRLHGNIDWQRPGAEGAVPRAQGSLTLRGTLAALKVTHTLSAPMRITSTGTLGYRDGKVHVDLTHRWPAQPLPVHTPTPVALKGGELTSKGTPDSLALHGQADVTVHGQTLHVDLDGNADTRALRLNGLKITDADQTLTLKGRLGYAKGLDWQLQAQGQHLNPAVIAPDWPGNLSLDAASEGHWSGASDWRVTVQPLQVDGTLKDTDLSLTGQASQNGGERMALRLQGQWGKDRLSASGTVGDTLKLDGTLAVAALGRWDPDLGGRASADWRLRGPLATPSLSGRLQGTQLSWRDWHADSVDARFDNLSLGQRSMRLDLRATTLQQGDATRADRLTIVARGSRAQHTITVTAQRDSARSRLDIDAGLDAQRRWHGTLREWTLSQPKLGEWALQKPVPFTLAADRQSLGRLCLAARQGPGRLCLSGEHRANGDLQAQLTVHRLPLALANPWLDGNLKLAGEAEADARFGGSVSQPEGRWNLAISGGKVTVTGTDVRQTLVLSRAELHGELKQGRLRDKLDLVVRDRGELHADIDNGLGMDRPLSGEVRLSIPRLDDLAPLIPRVSEIKGRIRGDLRLSGTLDKPGAAGRLTLDQGEVTVPELGTRIDAIQLTLAGDPAGLDIKGSARFGDQPLTLSGRWDPARSPLAVSLTARGQDLLVADRTDAKIYLSPDLTLNGDQDGLHLTGQVKVPQAELKPRELPPNAVTVSPDQVLVDAKSKTQSPIPFSMAVTVSLGDKVHFQGFGLDATLGGELKVTQQPGQPAQLYGDLVIVQGRYKAYGQNLAIDNGRLLFQGPPDNPGLDIRAIRKIPAENQTVGVQLSGTLQQPQARIFSDPQLEQSQAMSYLLTGHALNQGTQGDSAKVAQALALYGLQKGQGVTQKIGSTLGLDEITVGSDWGTTEDAALMLGKQLSDRLYLTYAVGLFNAVSTVMLRYTLTRTLHLEAQSSTKSQSIDLIWEKELK